MCNRCSVCVCLHVGFALLVIVRSSYQNDDTNTHLGIAYLPAPANHVFACFQPAERLIYDPIYRLHRCTSGPIDAKRAHFTPLVSEIHTRILSCVFYCASVLY